MTKYGNKTKLCQANLDSFIAHLKSEKNYAYLAEDVYERFDISHYEDKSHFFWEKNKKRSN